MGDNMVSAVQSIIELINGQRNSVDRVNQPIAVGDLDQQVVQFFIDAGSSGKDVFPGMCCQVSQCFVAFLIVILTCQLQSNYYLFLQDAYTVGSAKLQWCREIDNM